MDKERWARRADVQPLAKVAGRLCRKGIGGFVRKGGQSRGGFEGDPFSKTHTALAKMVHERR